MARRHVASITGGYSLHLDVAVEVMVSGEALQQLALASNPAVADLAKTQHLIFDGWVQHGDALIFRWAMPEPVKSRPEEVITLDSVLKRRTELQREGRELLEAACAKRGWGPKHQLVERSINGLTRGGYTTVVDVANATDAELLAIKDFGKGCLSLAREAFGP